MTYVVKVPFEASSPLAESDPDVRSIERIAVVTDISHFRLLVMGAGWTVP